MYAFVNEKIIDGVVYRAFRDTENPEDCCVEIDGKQEKVEDLKTYWSNLK